ncbi:MAG: tetratricopeptide repeat protein [Flavobacteriales bacterium]|nr:tetratricopeptide repeat protein [Flavobacteriales bacterium]
MGNIYLDQGNFLEAMDHFYTSFEIYEEIGNKEGVAISLNSIGALELKSGTLKAAKEHLKKALKLGEEIGSPISISNSSMYLSKLARQEGDHKKAFEMYELYIQMKDSINNESTQKATIRQQTKYEFEKAQLVAEQQRSEELRIKNEELKRRDNLQYSIIFLVILLVFGLILLLGFIKLSPAVAEGLIFFAFLILFEFLLVLADPYVDRWTGGEPMYKLLLNAMLAGSIFPLHAFFERIFKKRIVKPSDDIAATESLMS